MLLVWLAAISLPTSVAVISFGALAALLLFVLSGLFAPELKYTISRGESQPNDSEAFAFYLEALTDAKANPGSAFEVLTNGPQFYEAELAAIAQARSSINLEAYIFQRGEIALRFRDALAERARAGCRVKVLLDAFGSHAVDESYFAPLLEAGGVVCWYNGIAWYRLAQLDNRTHRELLIIDGRIGLSVARVLRTSGSTVRMESRGGETQW